MIEINENRMVIGLKRVIANPDGTFYDMKNRIRYGSEKQLLKKYPDIASGSSKYVPPSKCMPKTVKSPTIAPVDWRKGTKRLKQILKGYLPFIDTKFSKIKDDIYIAANGKLGVMFEDSAHYKTPDGWRMLKLSNGKAYKMTTGVKILYTTFGTGDYLVSKMLDLPMLAFGSDSASKNDINGNGIILKVIQDNDESGFSTLQNLAAMGFDIHYFDWDNNFDFNTNKWDLRDIANHISKESWEDVSDTRDFITGAKYKKL